MKKLNALSVYLFAHFTSGFVTKLVFTTYILYRVEVARLDPLQLVLLGTIMEASIFLFEIPTGVVADLYSRRASVIIGFLMMGLGFAIEGLAPLFWVIALSQFVWGFGATFLSGAFSAWVADEVGAKQAGPAFLRANQFSLAGNLLGIPFGVWLGSLALNLPFLAGGGLLIALAIFLALFMPETGFKPAPASQRQGWNSMFTTFKKGLDVLRGRPALITFAFIGLVVGLYSEAWDRLSQPFLLERFSFPDLFGLQWGAIQWLGVLNLAFILASLAANEFVKRRVDTRRGQNTLQGLQRIYAGMVAAMLLFTLTRNFYIAIAAMIVFNGLRAVTFPLTNAWINQQIESKVRATVLSITGQIDALGELGGGPVLGALGRRFSMQVALWASAATLSTSLPLFQRIRRLTLAETKKKGR
ncbi:MAG: MFS transporter [Anaerolineales bacterium]|nr:MFS transporter [Anaerolineales bacterium]